MTDPKAQILSITGASAVEQVETVQSLWSGYGQILRYYLTGGKPSRVIVKHIQLPEQTNHPRGWNTQVSHQRKLRSYEVETNWYQGLSKRTDATCRVPEVYHAIMEQNEILLIMEDLNASGFTRRLAPGSVTLRDAKNCLAWLASFHAKFIGSSGQSLWPIGTYWYLETRKDEWEQMTNHQLKDAAKAIDQKLNQASFQTLVHGDAKLANFCFGNTEQVAAVDFQYVGKGCGIKDVAYFISSCFDEWTCEKYESELLEHYFHQLELKWDNTIDYQEVKVKWLALYKYAWADLYRFLDGWSPGHWKMHDYSKRLMNAVIKELNQ